MPTDCGYGLSLHFWTHSWYTTPQPLNLLGENLFILFIKALHDSYKFTKFNKSYKLFTRVVIGRFGQLKQLKKASFQFVLTLVLILGKILPIYVPEVLPTWLARRWKTRLYQLNDIIPLVNTQFAPPGGKTTAIGSAVK